MCGIAGQIFLDGAGQVPRESIQKMTDALAHRGPDGEGIFVNGPVGLGHRRLSIIDLESGSQPMCNEDGTVWVVFNGEIYNYKALREDLIQRGHQFKSTSDTEVIVHLYEELGEECVSRLKGMFAFAVWDTRRRQLFLARDRVGIKPLYYATTANTLLFASEIKAILTHPLVSRRISPRAVDRFVTYYYLPGTDTLFEDIHKLEPGHTLTVHEGRIQKRQYWDLSFAVAPKWRSFSEAVDVLKGLLDDAVKAHMMSDVPVGVLLSGGVDSTGVLRHAAQWANGPLHTFTVGFDGEGFADERPYARLAAREWGTTHHEVSLSAQDFGDSLVTYARHMEEPVCEPPAIALYQLAKAARDASVKVLLSGEGGDEAFGGYNKYGYLLALEQMKRLLGSTKGLLTLALRSSALLGARSLPRFAKFVHHPLPQYYFSCTASPYTPFNATKASLYNGDFAAFMNAGQSDLPTRELFSKLTHLPLLHQMLHVDTKTWLPDDLLVKADKMTMAASVELRVPMLDTDILEFAQSIPAHYKIRGWPPKRILRAALKDHVPPEILKRKKVGFPVPYERWLRTDLRELVHDTVLNRSGVLSRFFRREALEALLQRHARADGYGQEVFSLLILELTCQELGRTAAA